MQNGLLLFMNVFGMATILSTAITIISINRIRNKYEDRAFAKAVRQDDVLYRSDTGGFGETF